MAQIPNQAKTKNAGTPIILKSKTNFLSHAFCRKPNARIFNHQTAAHHPIGPEHLRLFPQIRDLPMPIPKAGSHAQPSLLL